MEPTTEISVSELDAIAGGFDASARELAHSNAAPCDVRTYAVAYVRALAEVCGARASAECSVGESWDPSEWLREDWSAVVEAAELLCVEIDRDARRELWRLYLHPSDGAYTVCGLARPAGRFLVVGADGSWESVVSSGGIGAALADTKAEAEGLVVSLEEEGISGAAYRSELVYRVR